MFNFNKRLFLFTIISTGLIACADTQSINQQAAGSYQQVVTEANQKGSIDTSSTTAKRIHAVFQKIKPYAERANQTGIPFAWEVTVMKSDELNAWAMPGGKMMFYTGLVDKLNLDDNEIAVVMGHEMAHALLEHGKQKMNRSVATNVLGTIGTVAIAAATGYDMRDLVNVTTEFGLNRPFSRNHETEADEVGLFLIAEAGFDPQYAPGLWEKMSKATGSDGNILEGILSTHPTNAARRDNLARIMPQAIAIYNQSSK